MHSIVGSAAHTLFLRASRDGTTTRASSWIRRRAFQGEPELRLERTAAKMTHDELSIDLKTEDGGETLVFKLRGSLDLATAPTVRAALAEATEKGGHHLIVDLTQLEFLDSTGLGVLIGAHRRAAERGGSFRLIVSDGPIS